MAGDLFVLGLVFEYEEVEGFLLSLQDGGLDDGFIFFAQGLFSDAEKDIEVADELLL